MMQTRFEIEPDYADALRAAGLADFDALMNTPAGPPTSKHRHRETVPIEFDVAGQRKRFFLKRVFKVPAQHGWRPWLRGKPGYSQPVREWDAIKMMRDAGLPVMKRVAVGERRSFGIPTQALILVEDVGMQWTLENWLIPGFPKPLDAEKIDTRKLWFELGKLQRKFSLAGFDWPDAHSKHVYAEPVADTSGNENHWRFALIDVERVVQSTPLPEIPHKELPWLSHGELAGYLKKSDSRPTKADKRRDSHHCSVLQSMLPRFNDSIETAHYLAGRHDHTVVAPTSTTGGPHSWADGLTRALPLPDGYVHPRAEGVRWRAGVKCTDKDRELIAHIGIRDVASAFDLVDTESLNKPGLQSHRDRLRLKAKDQNGREVTLYIKRYRQPPFREQLRRIVEADRAHSTAYWEYQTARRLMEVGIPTMRAVAVGEEMNGWWERRSFVVTAAVAGESLELLARQWQLRPETRPSVKEHRNLINRLALLKHRLRVWHYYHRDLYLSHIFMSHNSQGEPVLQLIDLARMLHAPCFEQRWEIKDLAALAYSTPRNLLTRTDYLRFLRAAGYGHFITSGQARNHPISKSLRRHLLNTIGQVERRVAKMARHDAKRAARLGIRNESANRPLAGSTNTQSANTPTE